MYLYYSILIVGLTVKEFPINALEHKNVIVVQDPDDERHVLLRPIEKTNFTEFLESMERSFGEVDANKELWDVEVHDLKTSCESQF